MQAEVVKKTFEVLYTELNLGERDLSKLPVEIPDFTREHLTVLFSRLGFRRGVEIGVQQGKYSRILKKNNPDLELSCIDPWSSYVIPRSGDYPQKLSEKYYRDAQRILQPLGCTLLRMTSDEALSSFEDNSLDFVYIDGDHDFQHVTNDVMNYWKKVRPGGIVAGHDYHIRRKWKGTHVVAVLKGITEVYRIRPWFVFDYSGVTPPSWMFVKE